MRPSIVCLFVWKQNPSDSKNHAYHPLTIAIVTISKQFSKEIDLIGQYMTYFRNGMNNHQRVFDTRI